MKDEREREIKPPPIVAACRRRRPSPSPLPTDLVPVKNVILYVGDSMYIVCI